MAFNFKALLVLAGVARFIFAYHYVYSFTLKVIRFIIITIVRIVGVVALCLVLGAEIHEIVRNVQGYVKAVHTGSDVVSQLDAANNQTVVLQSMFGSGNISDVQVQSFRQACGYVEWTSVPDHAAGILFSTLFRFLNILVLVLLLISELSPPWPPITNFFLRFFPPLSEDASTGFLGAAMLWISTSILSTNVQNFAMVSAWMLFILGIINLLLSLIMGSSIRTHRSVIDSDKSTRPELPLNTTNVKVSKKGKVSYPAPADIGHIGFPTPAYGFNNHSKASSLAEMNTHYNSFNSYSHPAPAAGPLTRPSEMLEKRAGSPIAVGRTRSGKGILKIRTPEEEQEETDSETDKSFRTPPSYPH